MVATLRIMLKYGIMMLPYLVVGSLASSRVECDESFPRVHAFFYLWYGNPQTDGKYLHWNHEVLPHWNSNIRKSFSYGQSFNPPENVHSSYFPMRGCYSSRNRSTLKEQLHELSSYGVGAVVASWWGPNFRKGTSDTQGVSTDVAILDLIAAAEEVPDISVAFHLEPYPGRSAHTVLEDIQYLRTRTGNSSALLRICGRPVFYVYDSYHIAASDWESILGKESPSSLRSTPYDGFFIALFLEERDAQTIIQAQFDGFYTYFASEEVSYGSRHSNWKKLAAFARESGLLFSASVGPGYNDTKIRPWNAATTVDRRNGATYQDAWAAAVHAGADFVSITSYNEWGEGTQIEPAVAKHGYSDYGSGESGPMAYMEATARWSSEFCAQASAREGIRHQEL